MDPAAPRVGRFALPSKGSLEYLRLLLTVGLLLLLYPLVLHEVWRNPRATARAAVGKALP